MFNVSDKVVCVSASSEGLRVPSLNPPRIVGQVYVVRDVWASKHAGGCGYFIHLVGAAECYYRGIRVGYRPSRFRKLSEVQAENELARTITATLPASHEIARPARVGSAN